MIDLTAIWIAGGVAVFGVISTGVSFIGKKVLDLDKRQAAHEATDTATFHALAASLRETKEGVTAGNEKLDQLITHMLENPAPAQRRSRKR